VDKAVDKPVDELWINKINLPEPEAEFASLWPVWHLFQPML
jgi:hypothetical protein